MVSVADVGRRLPAEIPNTERPLSSGRDPKIEGRGEALTPLRGAYGVSPTVSVGIPKLLNLVTPGGAVLIHPRHLETSLRIIWRELVDYTRLENDDQNEGLPPPSHYVHYFVMFYHPVKSDDVIPLIKRVVK